MVNVTTYVRSSSLQLVRRSTTVGLETTSTFTRVEVEPQPCTATVYRYSYTPASSTVVFSEPLDKPPLPSGSLQTPPESGVPFNVIALWLGHESPVTTHHYVEANLAMKERALAKLHEADAKIQRYRAPDSLIDFLKTL